MAEDCAHLYDHLENFSDTYCKICFIPVITSMCNQKQPLFDNRRTVWILFDFLTVMAVLSLGRYLRVFIYISHWGATLIRTHQKKYLLRYLLFLF